MRKLRQLLHIPKPIIALVSVMLFALGGMYVARWSGAATMAVGSEAENGALTGCAVTTSYAAASGGRAVVFPACAGASACSTAQPSGVGITTYQSLSGSTFSDRVNSAPAANLVSLPAGTFGFNDFGEYAVGVWAGANITGRGLLGSGPGNTTIQINPNSSTKASQVPTAPGTTNQVYMTTFTAPNLELGCFTLLGTPQGHLFDGIRMHAVSNAHLHDLALVGTSPGNDLVPPGETFAINDYRGTNNSFTNVEIDGAGTGASAFGSNSTAGGTWTDCYAHDHPYSAGIALWQMTGTMTLTRFMSVRNRTGINLERVNGTVNIVRPELRGNTATDFFVGNDQGSTKVNIYDPVLAPGQKIRVYYPVKEQGNTNIQLKSDIKVFVNGVDVSASTIQYL